MIGSSLLILYGIVSALGAVAMLIKGSAKNAAGYIYLFLLCHAALITIGIVNLFTSLHVVWFITIFIACLVSRWLNGKFVFAKNNWLHYIIVALIFVVGYFLL